VKLSRAWAVLARDLGRDPASSSLRGFVPDPRAGALFLLGNLVGALGIKKSVGADTLCDGMKER
jgi:hypothetical protein